MEFISAGVPMIGWPHFFDQFENARLVCDENKAGKILLSRMRYNTDHTHQISYVNKEFDAQDVYVLFKEVMVDNQQYYKNNMLRL